MMASFILLAIFGITSLGNGDTAISAPVFLVPELAALTLLVLFLRHARLSPAPIIPLRLLRGRGFAAVNAVNLLWGGVGFGFMSLIPLYAQNRYHLPVLGAGTLLAARAVGMIAVGSFATFALRRTGYRLPMMVGYSVIALRHAAHVRRTSPRRWAPTSGSASARRSPALATAWPIPPRGMPRLSSRRTSRSITGLRNMFNYFGIIFAVSIATSILNRSADPGLAQAHLLWVAGGILLLVMVPLVTRVPEHKGKLVARDRPVVEWGDPQPGGDDEHVAR